jgi:hypothetical protein
VTQVLARLAAGLPGTAGALPGLAYAELRQIASRRECSDHVIVLKA